MSLPLQQPSPPQLLGHHPLLPPFHPLFLGRGSSRGRLCKKRAAASSAWLGAHTQGWLFSPLSRADQNLSQVSAAPCQQADLFPPEYLQPG